MNFSDIRDMDRTQWLFWAIAICTTLGVVSASIILAFFGNDIQERFHSWADRRKNVRRWESQVSTTTVIRQRSDRENVYSGFQRGEVP